MKINTGIEFRILLTSLHTVFLALLSMGIVTLYTMRRLNQPSPMGNRVKPGEGSKAGSRHPTVAKTVKRPCVDYNPVPP